MLIELWKKKTKYITVQELNRLDGKHITVGELLNNEVKNMTINEMEEKLVGKTFLDTKELSVYKFGSIAYEKERGNCINYICIKSYFDSIIDELNLCAPISYSLYEQFCEIDGDNLGDFYKKKSNIDKFVEKAHSIVKPYADEISKMKREDFKGYPQFNNMVDLYDYQSDIPVSDLLKDIEKINHRVNNDCTRWKDCYILKKSGEDRYTLKRFNGKMKHFITDFCNDFVVNHIMVYFGDNHKTLECINNCGFSPYMEQAEEWYNIGNCKALDEVIQEFDKVREDYSKFLKGIAKSHNKNCK